MFLEGGKAYRTIAEELGIWNSQQIERWVHDYRREGEMGLMKPKRRPRKKQEGVEAELARLRVENELLKKFHEELRKLTKEEPGTE
ncbi:MAG: helix-turn-helix domain-containing protein [Anaerolineales bacterium]